MTHIEFEKACESVIGGKLWDHTFNPDYDERVTLSVAEMRRIANVLRASEGMPWGKIFDPIEQPSKSE